MSTSGAEAGSPSKPAEQVSPNDACVAFFQRVLRGEIGEPGEDNSKLEGAAFYKLILKLQAAGNKDAVKIPLRVLRDEIGRAYFSSAQKNKTQNLDTLFQLYESLEATCQEELRSAQDKQPLAPSLVLVALRERLTRLVVGETWESFPELKTQALKLLYKLAVKENLVRTKTANGSPAAAKRPSKLSRALSMTGGNDNMWANAINDLGKAPSSKLLPLIKILLAQSASVPVPSAPGSEETSPRESRTGELETQASDASNLSNVNSRLAAFNLDDLLGLNDSVPATPTGGPPTPGASGLPAGDPFQVLANENGNRAPSTPTQSARQNGQAQFDAFGQNKIAAVHRGSSEFGRTESGNGLGRAESGNGFGRTESSFSQDENAFPTPASAHAGTASNVSTVSLESKPSQPRALTFTEPSAFSKQPSLNVNAGGDTGKGQVAPGLTSPLFAQPSGTLFGAAQQDAFNPFGLPSPSYATPVSPFQDNSFADVSPVAFAPPQPVPKPMRAPPPAPPSAPQTLNPASYAMGSSAYQSAW
ncbi:hypothetical protein WJX72_003749 [[Myrmecia] bisecta]|uniref:Uncharacterized protein n=1 Tax=[Myrmecia] bisecta TaxID=41462 RepID=A0AAW1Q3A3_9CHLO